MNRLMRRIAVLCMVLVTLPTFGDHLTEVTLPAGGNQSHTNQQPYLGINYIVNLQGEFDTLGEVAMFAGNFAPRGWAFAHGQLLPIAQNTALFSRLGTNYGGDGRTTFGLPDLRGRTAVGIGAAPGQETDWNLGMKLGTSDNTLTLGQMPNHNHSIDGFKEDTSFTGGGAPVNNIAPSLALDFKIATQGVYPSRNITAGDPQDAGGSETLLAHVRMFAGNPHPDFPNGHSQTHGQLLQISQNTAVFSLLGITFGGDGRTNFGLPDTRGRAVMGARQGPGLSNRQLGQKVGSDMIVITEAQLGTHNHDLPPYHVPTETNNTGGSNPIDNMQPTLTMNYIIALSGVFPPRNLTTGGDDPEDIMGAVEPYIGEIAMFAGNFAPRGWAFADGQLLPINQFQALFSILGTTYGGDGRTTFALPDLRGRIPLGVGSGPGLPTVTWGQKSGTQSVTLTEGQIPSHAHNFIPEPSSFALLMLGAGSLVMRRKHAA